jgi:hypothetical protein
VSYNFFSLLNLWGLPGDVTAVHTCLLLLPPALLSVEPPTLDLPDACVFVLIPDPYSVAAAAVFPVKTLLQVRLEDSGADSLKVARGKRVSSAQSRGRLLFVDFF